MLNWKIEGHFENMKNKLLSPLVMRSAGTFLLGVVVGHITGIEGTESGEAEIENRESSERTSIKHRSSVGASASVFGGFASRNPRGWQHAAVKAQDSGDVVESDALLLVLVSEWAKRDAYAALAYAGTVPNRSDLVYEALRQMAKQDPNEALEWLAGGAISVDQKNYFMRAVYAGMASSDPEGALGLLEQMPKGAQRDQLVSLTLNEWAKHDIHAAFDWLETAEMTPQFSQIYQEVMGRYVEQDPEQAAGLVSQMESGDMKLNLASQVATKLADQDVHFALEWLQSLGDLEKKYALLGVMDRWSAGENGDDALNYLLENYRDSNNDELFTVVAMNLSRTSPETLMKSFSSLNEFERVTAAQQLANNLVRSDPERGLQWIGSLESGAAKDQALKSSLAFYQYSNVSHAFGLAETITSPALRQGQMREVMETWMSVNPAAAEQALAISSVLSVDEKEEMMRQVYANHRVNDYVLPAKQ
ncbi:hypothetical protein ACFPK9_09020 [Rubritalea spongiae]|uniref:hypothetical protein n=1 Tax=Rubritalea spongiae TaxID=430797 RepID=UPI00360C095D